jgi:ankyrin repeat protein
VDTADLSRTTQHPARRTESEPLRTLSAPKIEMFPNPTQLVFPGGTMLPTMLAQACLAVSNGQDWSFTLTRSIFDWVEISAELSDLRSFFSMESYTVTAIWENLVDASTRFRRKCTFEILIDCALSLGHDQWIRRRSGNILCGAVAWNMVQTVRRLLALGIPPDSQGVVNDQIGTPLQHAVRYSQPDIMNVICQYGADVNLQRFFSTSGGEEAPLFTLIDNTTYRGRGADTITACARILLDNGAQVDICRDSRGRHQRSATPETQDLGILVKEWFSYYTTRSFRPHWCTDYAWVRLGRDHEVVQILLERSSRAQNHVTVPGIIIHASKGLMDLKNYLGERNTSLDDQTRSALLEIALSWAAEFGELDALTCLLQFGVDPNVGTISCFLQHKEAVYWQPLHRAYWRTRDNLVSILKYYGADDTTLHPSPQLESPETTCDIMHRELLSHKYIFRPTEFSDSDIETDGIELLRLCLCHADQWNFPECASMCDFLWSKNVPKDIWWSGDRDSLHFAISQKCCVDMCKFLITRGYEVQRHPMDELVCPSTMLRDAVEIFVGDPGKSTKVIDFLIENGASLEDPPEGLTLFGTILNRDRILDWNPLEPADEHLFRRLIALGAPVDVPPGKHGTQQSVLCRLIEMGVDDDLIFYVINNSEDIDQQGDPLAMALLHGRTAVAESLLSRGAKVNQPPRIGFHGILQSACSQVWCRRTHKYLSPNVRLIEQIINLGADINGSTELAIGGSAPLHHAAYDGMIEVACLLMMYGANVNARGRGPGGKAMRPLDYAARYGRLDMVHLLRGAGAISAHPGETGVDGAVRCAEERRHYSISDYLRSTIDRGNI